MVPGEGVAPLFKGALPLMTLAHEEKLAVSQLYSGKILFPDLFNSLSFPSHDITLVPGEGVEPS